MASMWVQLMVCLVLGRTVSSVQCPNGRKCEESSTCCKLPGEDEYICCNQPQFTGTSLRMLSPVRGNEVSGVECPDGSTCPAEHSCQLTRETAFACCPWLEAISCAEGLRCCPLGTHCSANGRSCVPNEDLNSAAIVGAVQCPGSEWECPDDSTCCLMIDGSWGCCPMPKASCCADKIHCCPHGTTCDLAQERCLEASGEQPLSKKFPAKKKFLALDQTQKNICPSNRSSCPDTATCCLLPTGSYGCCLLQDAVCCSDHLHCCPQGTQCDLKHSICTTTASQRSWPITRLSKDLLTVHDVECDAKYRCPDGNTCCKTTSDSWGCCPLEEAVCCSDHAHCCPKGYQCDLAEGICLKGGQSIPWLAKINPSSVATSAGIVVQCDPHTACQDGETCCQLATGAWACCPLPQAICCQDHAHCCPGGYICEVSSGSCLKGGERIPWSEKKAPAVGSLLSSREAVCCKDQAHCCPKGYSCDVAHSSCVRRGELLLTPILARQESYVICDDFTICEDGQTCCQLASGAWACCPFPNAVCCLDHIHCCPSSFVCEPATGRCLFSQHSLPWAPKLHAKRLRKDGIRCNDTASCEEGQTCCRNKAGAWSCCQLPNAVCCEDHQHCCPSGYTCNVVAQTCEKRYWLSPFAARGLQSFSRMAAQRSDLL